MQEFKLDSSATVRSQLSSSGLQEILDLENLTEIAVNEPKTAWFDRGNGWESKELQNLTLDMCFDLAKSLSVYGGLTIPLGIDMPLASVVLPDGERGQIAVPPATKNNVVSFTFRKPSTKRFTLADYSNSGRFNKCNDIDLDKSGLSKTDIQLLEYKKNKQVEEFFKLAVKSKKNILLVGGTGSGKTTFMKSLVDNYPKEKRLFTVEDVEELTLPNHPNHLNLFYKKGGVTPKEIIESCMRMKPDHVLLAELRGDEAETYLKMLNTGHQGSITTIHANDCISAISRLTDLIKQTEVGITLPHSHILNTVKSTIDVIAFFESTYLIDLYFNPSVKNNILSNGGVNEA